MSWNVEQAQRETQRKTIKKELPAITPPLNEQQTAYNPSTSPLLPFPYPLPPNPMANAFADD